MGKAAQRIRTVWRWLAAAAAAVALLAALAIGAFRLAVELLPGYQDRIAAQLRDATGLRLSVDALDARIGRYGPEITFSGARVLPASGEQPLFSAAAGRASLALGRSLLYRRLEVGRIVLERPRLEFVVHEDGRVRFAGQPELPARGEDAPAPTLERLPRGLFEVRGATLVVEDRRRRRDRFELTGVDVGLERRGASLQLQGRVALPRHLGSVLSFEARAAGELDDPATLAWEARAEGLALQLAGWATLLPDASRWPEAGRGSLRVAASGNGTRLATLRLQPDLAGLQLPGGGASFTRVAGDLRLRLEPGLVTLQARDLELSRPGAPWQRPTDVEAGLTLRDGRPDGARLRADYLLIDNLAALSGALPAGPLRQRIESLAPRGLLQDVDLIVTRVADGTVPDISGSLRFSDLGFEPQGRAPGISGFDGVLDGRGAGGLVLLRARDASLAWPLQWRAVATLPRLEGRLEWSRFGDGLRLWLDDAEADTGHGRAAGKLRMLLRPGQPPLLDLQAQVYDADLTHAWRYLPAARLKPRSLSWLDAAFRRGRVTAGWVSVTGPTRGFPYRKGEGRFRAAGRVEGATLFYAPGWPEARGVDATVEFNGPAMHVVAERARVGGLAVSLAEASSADLRDAVLAVRADARGDAARALALLQGSPLAPALGEAFRTLAGNGPLSGELAMVLPLKQFDQKVITAAIALDGVTLRRGAQAPAVGALQGTLWVRNRELQAPELTGRLLGGPLTLSVRSSEVPDGALTTEVEARGRLAATELRTVARLPLNAGLEGEADWRGSLLWRRPAPGGVASGTLRLASDLQGLASALPAPFTKPAAAARPLAITVEFGAGSPPRIDARLGRDLQAALLWRSAPEAPPVQRGVLHFGAGPAPAPAGPGLWLSGALDSLSLSELLALRWEEPRGRRLQEWLGGADLSLRRLEALGYGFTGVSGRLRQGNRAWELQVASAEAAGRLALPFEFPGDVPMVVELERLRLGERQRGGDGEPDPRRWPALRVAIGDLVFDGRQFGRVQAELARGTAGLTLNRFELQHAAFSAEGRGSWLVAESGRAECRLDVDLQAGDVAGFLSAMNLGEQITGRRGRLSARLRWPGPPEASAFGRLSGRLEIAAEDGRLVAVEPGAGRVLGLMSLAHLPRRLALDFGDLTGEGLAFDRVQGTFTLNDGEAWTDDLLLRGSAAEIGLAGRTSLRERSYDQTAVVTGQLGASLGVAGALAGGPAVGAALLLFSQVFKGALQGMTRGYYRITGSWDDPQVRRIDAREMRETQEAAAAVPEAQRRAEEGP